MRQHEGIIQETSQPGQGGRAITLTEARMVQLQGEIRELPTGTKIEPLGFMRLMEEKSFSDRPVDEALYDLKSLKQMEGVLTQLAKDKGDMGFCGFKLPIVLSLLSIEKPGEPAVVVPAVAQAIMVISDSPLHWHNCTYEEYFILNPDEWPDLVKALHDNNIKENLVKDGFMVSGPRMEDLDLTPTLPNNESIPIPITLIHGFGAANEGDALLVMLNFIYGLVPGDKEMLPPDLRPDFDIKGYRDEHSMNLKARAQRAAMSTESH